MEDKIEKMNIKTLNFGVKGTRKGKDISSSDKRKAKTVKTKKKIDSRLKRELLKNYGFFIEDN